MQLTISNRNSAELCEIAQNRARIARNCLKWLRIVRNCARISRNCVNLLGIVRNCAELKFTCVGNPDPRIDVKFQIWKKNFDLSFF